MHKYERLTPEQALTEAAGTLSCTTPRDAWSLCAMLSTTEAFAKEADDLIFFPTLNFEKVRLLCEAVLDSRALDYKSEDLQAYRIIDALNYANRALTDYEGIRLSEELRQVAGSELALRAFMSRLGNIQIRYQDHRFHERVGRLIGMVEVLPRSHRAKMPEEFWAMADPVLERIRAHLEFPVLPLAAGIMALLELYTKPCEDILERYRQVSARGIGQANLFRRFLEDRHQYQPRFVLPVERGKERTVIDRFLELFGRTTRQLRELRREDERYRRGDIARRLSPLERYPIVLLSDTSVVVPNVRYVGRNFADIVHFSLWEERIPLYDEVRGGLQELYLHALIEARLPRITIIQERSYRRRKQTVKGTDLTLVEEGRLIVGESKARRILAETRLGTRPEDLLDNLGGAVDAVRNAEEKIAELYAGLPEFRDVQAVIDRTKSTAPIRVAVVGEEIAMMGEVLRELARSYPAFPQTGTTGLYCILGVDAFERAVEVAAATGKRLGDLLEEYINEATTIRHDAPPADEFGGRVGLEGTFAVSFFRQGAE